LCLANLPDGTLVSGQWTGIISIWNTQTNEVVRHLKGHKGPIWCLKVLSNGTLASGSGDETIKIWSPVSGVLLRTLSGHKDGVWSLEELNTDVLVSGSWDKTIKVWDMKTGDLLNTAEMIHPVVRLISLRDSDLLAIQCYFLAQILIVNAKTLKDVRQIDCDKMYGPAMTMLSDGNLVTCKEKINIWNSSSGQLVRTLESHEKEVWCLHLMDDGNLVSGCNNGEIQIWSPTSGELIHSFKAHNKRIQSLSSLKDGRLVTCEADSAESKTMKIWNLN
jgi:hypothetical protein